MSFVRYGQWYTCVMKLIGELSKEYILFFQRNFHRNGFIKDGLFWNHNDNKYNMEGLYGFLDLYETVGWLQHDG